MIKKFTTIVDSVPVFNVEAYTIHSISRQIMTDLIATATRGSRCRESLSLVDKDGDKYLMSTITLSNMKGTFLGNALVISEDPSVATQQSHANASSGETISCSACGGKLFYDIDRSLDYNNHVCAVCGTPANTLTETGACS